MHVKDSKSEECINQKKKSIKVKEELHMLHYQIVHVRGCLTMFHKN